MAVWKGIVYVSLPVLMSIVIQKWGKYRALKLLPLLPAWIALMRKLRPGTFKDRAFVAVSHCVYHGMFALLVSKWIPFEYGCLWTYMPLPLVFERGSFGLNDVASHNDIFYKYYIQLFWSLPIVTSMKILSNIYTQINISHDKYINHGIHAPMISIIDNNIAVGRLPLNKRDVDIIFNEPYNIRGIINMCIESNGQINHYIKKGIKYVQYKTVDTLQPKLSDIFSAMLFIEQFVLTKDERINENEQENNKRILIHCRGGRNRSATIALCWLLKANNLTVEEALNILISKREAIHSKIKYYDVVHKYAASLTHMPDAPPPSRRVISFHLMD